MAGISGLSSKLSSLIFLLVVFDIQNRYLKHIHHSRLWNGAAEVHVGREISKTEVSPVASRSASGLRSAKRSSPGLVCIRTINLVEKLIFVNILLLCNDVSLNPGPASLACPKCLKTIKKTQSQLQCVHCDKFFHLRCLGSEYESLRMCSLCSTVPLNESVGSDDSQCFLPDILKNMTETRGLKIVHQNIRSLPNKIDELRLIISELGSRIHLITLSESWAHQNITDAELEIPGYTLFRRDRGSKCGGLAIYKRNDLSAIRRSDLENECFEGLWMEILIPKSRSFLVGTFYRPPNSSNHHNQEFLPWLENALNLATGEEKEVLILGDLNCDLLSKRDASAECKQLKTVLRCLNFTQLINVATRIAQNSSTLLDIVASNCPQNISSSGVASAGLSDHETVFCVRKLNSKRAPAEI